MKLRILGTGAGGGLPQWNCGCDNCRRARRGDPAVPRRTQCSLAVTANDKDWLLLNATSDLRIQLEATPELWPVESGRGSKITAVALTSGDLDCTLGVLTLREGRRLRVIAPAPVQLMLDSALRIGPTMNSYCGIDWKLVDGRSHTLLNAEEEPTGLMYSAFAVAGKLPRYSSGSIQPPAGSVVGYRIADDMHGKSIAFVPSLAAWSSTLERALRGCDIVFVDGTFWSEDELKNAGGPRVSASEMGHLPIGESDGSLSLIGKLNTRCLYLHINNTNPIANRDSAEHACVLQAGVEIAADVMQLEL
jgi:pyrroloquinoline quinone biosynthesis protein B